MSNIKGNRIKMLRLQMNLDQLDLAKAIGVSRSTIGMLESGKRNGTKKNIKKLATFFDVSIDYLEGREDQEDDILDFLLSLNITKDGKISNEEVPELLDKVEHYIKKKKGLLEGN